MVRPASISMAYSAGPNLMTSSASGGDRKVMPIRLLLNVLNHATDCCHAAATVANIFWLPISIRSSLSARPPILNLSHS